MCLRRHRREIEVWLRPIRYKDVGGWHHTPSALFLFPRPGRTRDVLHGRLVGPRGRFWTDTEKSPAPEFDSRTVQVLYRLRHLYRPLCLTSERTAPTFCTSVGRSEKPEVRSVLLTYFKTNIAEKCTERRRGLQEDNIKIDLTLCVRACVLARVHE